MEKREQSMEKYLFRLFALFSVLKYQIKISKNKFIIQVGIFHKHLVII